MNKLIFQRSNFRYFYFWYNRLYNCASLISTFYYSRMLVYWFPDLHISDIFSACYLYFQIVMESYCVSGVQTSMAIRKEFVYSADQWTDNKNVLQIVVIV
jgi:hypothetical protein